VVFLPLTATIIANYCTSVLPQISEN